MILHCVFFEPRAGTPRAAIDGVLAELGALVDLVDGMDGFQAGPNRDFEKKSARWTHGFVCLFRDRAAHLAYERHPLHAAAGGKLVALCEGGADGIIVYDLDTGQG